MIEYNATIQVVVMDLVDLEHCGFRHDDFVFELQAGGIDAPAARWPVALLVNFAGGAVVTPTTSDETITEMKDAYEEFKTLQESLLARRQYATAAQPWCDKCDKRAAMYFAEHQLLVLNDPEFVAETDSVVYGWWGECCAMCLHNLLQMPELIWLEAIRLWEVDAVRITAHGYRGWREYDPDWSRAVVRVGSRTPSEGMCALLAAGKQQPPLITQHEALGRLAVLRLLPTQHG